MVEEICCQFLDRPGAKRRFACGLVDDQTLMEISATRHQSDWSYGAEPHGRLSLMSAVELIAHHLTSTAELKTSAGRRSTDGALEAFRRAISHARRV